MEATSFTVDAKTYQRLRIALIAMIAITAWTNIQHILVETIYNNVFGILLERLIRSSIFSGTLRLMTLTAECVFFYELYKQFHAKNSRLQYLCAWMIGATVLIFLFNVTNSAMPPISQMSIALTNGIYAVKSIPLFVFSAILAWKYSGYLQGAGILAIAAFILPNLLPLTWFISNNATATTQTFFMLHHLAIITSHIGYYICYFLAFKPSSALRTKE